MMASVALPCAVGGPASAGTITQTFSSVQTLDIANPSGSGIPAPAGAWSTAFSPLVGTLTRAVLSISDVVSVQVFGPPSASIALSAMRSLTFDGVFFGSFSVGSNLTSLAQSPVPFGYILSETFDTDQNPLSQPGPKAAFTGTAPIILDQTSGGAPIFQYSGANGVTELKGTISSLVTLTYEFEGEGALLPEPASLALLSAGLIGLAARRRRGASGGAPAEPCRSRAENGTG